MATLGTVAVIGVGLIGGSIGMAVGAGAGRRVVGMGRSRRPSDEAVSLGAVDRATTDLTAGVADADVVVVCTPVDAVIAADVRCAAGGGTRRARSPTPAAPSGRSSRPSSADRAAPPSSSAATRSPARSARGGVHADADLFEGRVCVLTPTPRHPGRPARTAPALLVGLGSRVVETEPAEPTTQRTRPHEPPASRAWPPPWPASVPGDVLALAAGAYRDGTRVAGADTGLWAAIFLENRGPVLNALDRFDAGLAAFRAPSRPATPRRSSPGGLRGRELRRGFDPGPAADRTAGRGLTGALFMREFSRPVRPSDPRVH